MKQKINEKSSEINIGLILKTYINRNKISKAALGRKINRTDNSIAYYQKSASLYSAIILELSHALKHNFFQDIAALLPASYSTDAPVDSTASDEITALKLENAILKAEKAVLLQVLSAK